MATYRNPDQLMKALCEGCLPFFRKRFARLSVQKVVAVSGTEVSLEGGGTATRFCSGVSAGKLVLVLSQGGSRYVVGVRQ